MKKNGKNFRIGMSNCQQFPIKERNLSPFILNAVFFKFMLCSKRIVLHQPTIIQKIRSYFLSTPKIIPRQLFVVYKDRAHKLIILFLIASDCCAKKFGVPPKATASTEFAKRTTADLRQMNKTYVHLIICDVLDVKRIRALISCK